MAFVVGRLCLDIKMGNWEFSECGLDGWLWMEVQFSDCVHIREKERERGIGTYCEGGRERESDTLSLNNNIVIQELLAGMQLK